MNGTFMAVIVMRVPVTLVASIGFTQSQVPVIISVLKARQLSLARMSCCRLSKAGGTEQAEFYSLIVQIFPAATAWNLAQQIKVAERGDEGEV